MFTLIKDMWRMRLAFGFRINISVFYANMIIINQSISPCIWSLGHSFLIKFWFYSKCSPLHLSNFIWLLDWFSNLSGCRLRNALARTLLLHFLWPVPSNDIMLFRTHWSRPYRLSRTLYIIVTEITFSPLNIDLNQVVCVTLILCQKQELCFLENQRVINVVES